MISDFWDLTSLTGHIMVAIGTENIPPWANIEKKQELVYFAQKIQKISHKIQDHKMKLAQKSMVPSPCTQRNLGTSEFISGGVVERRTFRSCDLRRQPSRLSACTRVEIGSWYHLRWEHCGCTGCAACKHSPCCEWLNPALVGPALNELKNRNVLFNAAEIVNSGASRIHTNYTTRVVLLKKIHTWFSTIHLFSKGWGWPEYCESQHLLPERFQKSSKSVRLVIVICLVLGVDLTC